MLRVVPNLEASRETGPRGEITIVVDALRFSSSVIVGLASRAAAFIPVKTVAEAKRLYRSDKRLILSGEREGLKPRGFHLGNSPTEFKRTDLDGKTVVITTTNGTKALESSRGSEWLLIGSFVNATAVSAAASRLAENEKDISIILASRGGKIFLEDFICAGLLASRITNDMDTMNDEAMAAELAWIGAENDYERVIRKSSHAVYLEGIGYGDDVELCLQRDLYDLVPYAKGNKIVRLQHVS